MTVPVDNPITPEKVALGKMLFFDKRLGKDGKMSCESLPPAGKGLGGREAILDEVRWEAEHATFADAL